MKLNRRCFLKATGTVAFGASSVLAQSETSRDSQSSKKAAISVIRIAQIKVYPQKGKIELNHQKLMDIL